MSRCYSIGILLILTIVSLAGWVTADAALILEIPEEIVLSGVKFGLVDLGVIRGGSEADRKLLETISLGSVPAPGQVRVFSRSYLQFILSRQAFERLPELQMGMQVTVRPEAFCVQRPALEQAIRRLVETTGVDGMERWAELRNVPEAVWLPKGNWKIQAEPIGKLPLVGRALFKVTISNGSDLKSINVSGSIRAKALVYRAIRDLPLHLSLKPEDFLPETVELRGREFIGKLSGRIRSTAVIRKGQVLLEKQYEESPLVTEGSEVTVVIKNGEFEIKLTGIARVDGWLDQKILVMNPVSKKSFTGRVVDIDTVEVRVK